MQPLVAPEQPFSTPRLVLGQAPCGWCRTWPSVLSPASDGAVRALLLLVPGTWQRHGITGQVTLGGTSRGLRFNALLNAGSAVGSDQGFIQLDLHVFQTRCCLIPHNSRTLRYFPTVNLSDLFTPIASPSLLSPSLSPLHIRYFPITSIHHFLLDPRQVRSAPGTQTLLQWLPWDKQASNVS